MRVQDYLADLETGWEFRVRYGKFACQRARFLGLTKTGKVKVIKYREKTDRWTAVRFIKSSDVMMPGEPCPSCKPRLTRQDRKSRILLTQMLLRRGYPAETAVAVVDALRARQQKIANTWTKWAPGLA